jgi:hypothetical protein
MLNQKCGDEKRERAPVVQDRWRKEMLLKKLKEHLADAIIVGVALAVVGSAAGFFGDGILGALFGLASGFGTGVGVSVFLVAIYSKASGCRQPISVVPVSASPPPACTEE